MKKNRLDSTRKLLLENRKNMKWTILYYRGVDYDRMKFFE